MIQDVVLQKHMKKKISSSRQKRGISRKRKGNCGVVGWLMVLGGQTATCAFALANNNAARALNDVRPSVDVAVAVPSFIISPFGPSFYPLTSIRATLLFIHHVRLQSANIRTDVPAIGRRQTHSHTPSPMYVHSTGWPGLRTTRKTRESNNFSQKPCHPEIFIYYILSTWITRSTRYKGHLDKIYKFTKQFIRDASLEVSGLNFTMSLLKDTACTSYKFKELRSDGGLRRLGKILLRSALSPCLPAPNKRKNNKHGEGRHWRHWQMWGDLRRTQRSLHPHYSGRGEGERAQTPSSKPLNNWFCSCMLTTHNALYFFKVFWPNIPRGEK